MSVEIDDVLDDGTLATVTCPDTDDDTGTVLANGELVWSHTCSTISPAVLLSGLSRGTEGFSDLAPGDPCRPSCNDGVNDLTLTTGTSHTPSTEDLDNLQRDDTVRKTRRRVPTGQS